MLNTTDASASVPSEVAVSAIGVAASSKAPRNLTSGEFTTLAVVGGLVGILGLIGFVNSFAKVAAAAEPFFGWLAWSVPLGIDLGILAFSALDIALARLDLRVKFLRLVPWTLTGATVYLNVAGETDLFAIVAHAILPMLWVLAVEVGAHVLRRFAGLASETRMDTIRRSRWILALPSTFALWRRMILWEIRSYPLALQRERDRVLAKTDLQDTYGCLWRWKATRRERALYKLGELAPAVIVPEVEPVIVAEVEPAEEKPKPVRRARKPAAVAGDKPARKRAVPDITALLEPGRVVAKRLVAEDRPLTRDNLRAGLAADGQACSTNRVTALLKVLKSSAALEVPPPAKLALVSDVK
ncbi:DUF2637 domain-containing protein [Streptosporangium canum]|uniref:DUF2637 domain-containing protein n=1 Tax=Streptosporangium canum TaxID=324952 RepID=UPI0033BB8626